MVFAVKEQKIRIGVEYFVKNAQKARESINKFNRGVFQQNKEIQGLTSKQKFANTQTERLKTSNSKFGQVMGMNHKRLGDFNQSGYKFNTLGGRMANRLRMMSHGMRGFKMEMLGVMFFGMALARTMTGLLRTSLEWVGINEILATTLGLLFLPVALELLPWALKFMDYVSNLSDETKLWIGRIVVATAAIGGLLFIIGQTFLGIGSIIMAFGSLGFWLFILPGVLALLAIGFLLFRDKLTKLNKPIQDANDNLAQMGFIAPNAFSKVMDGAISLWSFLKDKFVNVWDSIVEGLPGIISKAKELFIRIVTFIPSLIPFMLTNGAKLFNALVEGFLIAAPKIIEALFNVLNIIINFISENSEAIMNFGMSILQTIVDGIENNFDKISEVVKKFLEAFGRFLEENEPILTAMVVGFVKTLADILNKVISTSPEIGALAGVLIGAIFGPMGALIGGVIGALIGQFGKEAKKMDLKGKLDDIVFQDRGAFVSTSGRTFASGGIVPGRFGSATPIIAHAGEKIVPIGGLGRTQTGTTNNSLAPNITINVANASEADIFSLTDEISRRMGTDFERLTKSRATF